jgi:hypothetical protein
MKTLLPQCNAYSQREEPAVVLRTQKGATLETAQALAEHIRLMKDKHSSLFIRMFIFDRNFKKLRPGAETIKPFVAAVC